MEPNPGKKKEKLKRTTLKHETEREKKRKTGICGHVHDPIRFRIRLRIDKSYSNSFKHGLYYVYINPDRRNSLLSRG
jgi:hypothetical protein